MHLPLLFKDDRGLEYRALPSPKDDPGSADLWGVLQREPRCRGCLLVLASVPVHLDRRAYFPPYRTGDNVRADGGETFVVRFVEVRPPHKVAVLGLLRA